jgi:hypothetical protein
VHTLLLLACTDQIVLIGDTAAVGDADTDTDTDSDADPVPVTDFSNYTGSRRFIVNDWFSCDESFDDVGVELTEGAEWMQMRQSCADCTRFYENTPSTDEICNGYVPIGVSWRAVEFGSDSAAVHIFTDSGNGLSDSVQDEDAGWNGSTILLDYEWDFGYTIYATGDMSFPVTGG